MGGPLTPKSPHSKPSKAHSAAYPHHHIAAIIANFRRRKGSLFLLAAIASLCSLSYLLGLWHRGAHRHVTTTNCKTTTRRPSLDFEAHHADDEEPMMMTSSSTSARLTTYPPCHVSYSEYTPCEHPKRSLRFSRRRNVFMERHCPARSELLKCRVPAPYGYRSPFKWPESRDFAWYSNVPHKELTVDKAQQNWIQFEDDRFRFPGGGTSFPNGADAYIREIGRLIDLQSGSIRTAIDTGCGVASWGTYLLSKNILTISMAPRDNHEAQVQFALERGVPALIGVMGTKRLPYPSRSFDMAHCSRCLIPWTQYEGVYLMEVDRVLRPGGYWILSGPPIRWKKYWKGWERTQEDLSAEQILIENIARSLCWKKVVEKDDIAIWQKPLNHFNCKNRHNLTQSPRFCPVQDPDKAWYTKMEGCLTPLPEVSDTEEVAGGRVAKWPERLTTIPPRISLGSIQGVVTETFYNDTEQWKRRVSYYKTVNNYLNQQGRYRNLLDMNAFLGGFAAALVHDPVWVMNVVPVETEINTLGVIYERGLIGTYQSWCEAMSTYPRTYDLIHADSIFTLYKNRCGMDDILLEMDRILRPEGSVIIRDDVDVLVKVKEIADALRWDSQIVDHEDGPLVRQKLLFAVKLYWTSPPTSQVPANSTSFLVNSKLILCS